jgi:methylthioribulose 1-phosphate dehydratase/enolase-phosphatase E1
LPVGATPGVSGGGVPEHIVAASNIAGLSISADIDAVVLDIEGTTTPLSFVTDVLFPYAAAHAAGHVSARWGTAELGEDVAALAKQSAADIAAGLMGATAVAVTAEHAALAGSATSAAAQPAAVTAAKEAVLANVAWQMGANRKTGALKALQGHIWRDGYGNGSLRGDVFPDTVTALQQWTAAGKRVYIYSSGSREAQRLLFAHSAHGDLRKYLSGYFDTGVGPKVEAGSYRDIALSLGVDSPCRVLFATDSLAEAAAAAAAGMKVAVTDRPGNLPLKTGHGFSVVKSLLEVV